MCFAILVVTISAFIGFKKSLKAPSYHLFLVPRLGLFLSLKGLNRSPQQINNASKLNHKQTDDMWKNFA